MAISCRETKRVTHVRIQWVVHVPAEVGHRGAAPVLKDVQIGLSLVLQGEKGERQQCWECSECLCRSQAPVKQSTIWPQYLANKKTQTDTSLGSPWQ